MPDTPAPASPTNLLDPLVKASADLIRGKLDERPLSPHVFHEISVAAKAVHKACTALDPVLDLPTTRGSNPLAPSTQTEGAGARTARELLEMFQEIAHPKEPKQSRKDLMAAIVVAEKAGLTDDAQLLRDELYGDPEPEVDDDLLPAKRKVELAHELIEQSNAQTARAKALLEGVKPHQIVDAESWDSRLAVNCVVRLPETEGSPDGQKTVVRDDAHLKECIEAGAEFVCERPHDDEDYSYTCDDPPCRCVGGVS